MSTSETDSDSDIEETKGKGAEKCEFDENTGLIVGSVVIWEENDEGNKVRTTPTLTTNFNDIPIKEYLLADTAWLDTCRKYIYCIIRAVLVDFKQREGSSGFLLSPNFMGTTRHSAEKLGGLFPFNKDVVVRSVINLRLHKNRVLSKKHIASTMYQGITGSSIENIRFNQNKILIDTPFDFTILKAPDALLGLKEQSLDLNIILLFK